MGERTMTRLIAALAVALVALPACSAAELTSAERAACNAIRDEAFRDKTQDRVEAGNAWKACLDRETAD